MAGHRPSYTFGTGKGDGCYRTPLGSGSAWQYQTVAYNSLSRQFEIHIVIRDVPRVVLGAAEEALDAFHQRIVCGASDDS